MYFFNVSCLMVHMVVMKCFVIMFYYSNFVISNYFSHFMQRWRYLSNVVLCELQMTACAKIGGPADQDPVPPQISPVWLTGQGSLKFPQWWSLLKKQFILPCFISSTQDLKKAGAINHSSWCHALHLHRINCKEHLALSSCEMRHFPFMKLRER